MKSYVSILVVLCWTLAFPPSSLAAPSATKNDPWRNKSFAKTMKAARDGNAAAQYSIGLRYEFGQRKLDKDPAIAGRFYKQAANNGHGRAQLRLGLLHRRGKGVKQDNELAKALLKKAMLQKIPRAFTALGSLLYEKSEAESLPAVVNAQTRINHTLNERAQGLFRRGAELGDSLALVYLGHYPRSDPDSWSAAEKIRRFKWYLLAAEKYDGKDVDYSLLYLAAVMNPKEIERAKAQAAEWRKRFRPRKN